MKIFLIFPYKSESEDIYEIVRLAVTNSGHEIIRARDYSGDRDIGKKVTEEIKNADIIIAEVSNYSKSTNVRGEFLKAQTFDKPIIPICSKTEELSFDVSNYQAILYDRLRMQESLVKPLLSYLGKTKPIDFLLNKTKDAKPQKNIKSIFVSYSHTDNEYLERLKIHLKPFEKKGQIDLWVDTKIKGGEKWKEKINSALDKSVIAILLISADFLASDFIVDNELPPLLKAAEEKGKIILPLIVKPCRFTSDDNLAKFQSINDPKHPLSKLTENDREETYVKVADLIDNLVK
ncbi:MAG: toll/interleukin-1 receptor domain-containing protein [Bacteroidota bacterium]